MSFTCTTTFKNLQGNGSSVPLYLLFLFLIFFRSAFLVYVFCLIPGLQLRLKRSMLELMRHRKTSERNTTKKYLTEAYSSCLQDNSSIFFYKSSFIRSAIESITRSGLTTDSHVLLFVFSAGYKESPPANSLCARYIR